MSTIAIIVGIVLFVMVWALLSCRYSIRNRKPWTSYQGAPLPWRVELKIYQLWTDDGYRLQIFHVRDKDRHDPSLKPVIMHHNLGGSAENWLNQGGKDSPAVILAGEGYDVYLTNARGNPYSYGHAKYKTSDKRFFDFSFQQMKFDIKANLEFVLRHSGKDKVHYIAHSEGATTVMAALADPSREIGKFLEKHLITFYAFAPVIFLKSSNMACTLFMGQFVFPPFRALLALFGVYSQAPKRQKNHWFVQKFFELNIWLDSKLCKPPRNPIHNLEAFETWSKNTAPGFGLSFQQIGHFLQGYSEKGDVKNFKKYNYGKKINLERYGTEEPPRYDLGLVQAKIVLYYVETDQFIKLESVEYLKEELCNADVKFMYKKGWNHGTFLFPKENKKFYQNLIPRERREI